MRKIITLVLTLFIVLGILPLSNSFKLAASSYYSYGCSANQFEVAYINDDGSFSNISCHGSFSEAKSAMKANKDYVVRYSKSYSPTLIVAMNSGLVYTYPGRGNSSTMNIYQNPNAKDDSRYKSTYVANHYEMTYVDTCDENIYNIASNGKGYVQVVLNGFEGFADLEYTDLVPSKYIKHSIPIWLGGRNVYEGEDPFLVVPYQNYYMIEKNGNYYDLSFYFFRAYPKGGVDGAGALSSKIAVDNAQNYLDAGMQAGVKYYSNDGIHFYADYKLRGDAFTVYNYYQFLSVRSTTNISADVFDRFVKDMKGSASVLNGEGSSFIKGQNRYGCNALIIYAMACLESAYGTSGYATHRNNLFGWSAYDDSPDDASYFSSVKNCVYEHMGRNLNWFMDYTNRRYFGSCVGNKGAGFNVVYASDPYWGAKIAAISYSIDKFANNKNGNLSDYNSVATGFVKNNYNDVLYSSNISWNPNIYKTADGNSVLYTGMYGSHYQKDLTVTVLEKVGSRYKIRSSNPVENGEINTNDGLLTYDWDKSVGYINENDLVLLNKSKVDETTIRPTLTYAAINSLRNVELTSDSLTISGVGAIHGMDFISSNESIKHVITFRSMTDSEKAYSFDVETIASEDFDMNDMYDYSFSGFNLSISLPNENLPVDSYYVELTTTNKDKTVTSYLVSPDVNLRNIYTSNDEEDYRVRMNDFYNYRFEFDVLSLPDDVDFNSIKTPSQRPESVSLDNVVMDEEGNVEIYGHAYMFYINYDVPENISYDVYLLDDKDNYLKLDTVLYDDGVNYKEVLNSKYDLSNISFKATGNISDLDGNYTAYLLMSNYTEDTNYKQFVEIPDYGLDLPSYETENMSFAFVRSNIRNRLILSAKAKDVQISN